MNNYRILFALMAVLCCLSCVDKIEDKEDLLKKAGVESFYNPAAERQISQYGEIFACTIKTLAAYELEIVCDSDEEWVSFEKGQSGKAGFNQFRLSFRQNETDQPRSAQMFILVDGYPRTCIAVFSQANIMTEQERNIKLNKHMHERLMNEYLWAESYSALNVDLTLDYRDFLSTYLLDLDDVNIEDGGYTKGLVSNPGQRFIYTNIQPVNQTTKAMTQTYGLGFGPFFASYLSSDGSVWCLAVSYVHPGSPADKAGIRRGDAIYMVNGSYVDGDNYESYNNELYLRPNGNYSLTFFRNGEIGDGKEITASIAAESYGYNPVLYCDIISDGVGYLILENFDLNCQSSLSEAINMLKSSGISELILDLRYNQGGSVAQSRWLTSCIAGASRLNDVFAALVYNDGTRELWQYRGGPDDYDGLGIGPDLGLDRVFVIGSYYTASAAEMVVNSLRGIGFNVCLIGGKTEGKNVGMTPSEVTADGVRYIFSPITFRIENAMGFSNYADGLTPDVLLSDQDLEFDDDYIDAMFPYSFGDWMVPGANPPLDVALSMISK